jgi:hypothetical protein
MTMMTTATLLAGVAIVVPLVAGVALLAGLALAHP